MNILLSTYRALYDMALKNGYKEAINFYKVRIIQELLKIQIEATKDGLMKKKERDKALRAERSAGIRHMIAVNRERIHHHAAMTGAGFILKNGRYYANK